MTVTTVNIACDIGLADDSEYTAGTLEFTLSGPDYDTASNDAIVPDTVRVTLDADGLGTAALWPVDRGTRNTHYRVDVVGSRVVNGVTTAVRFALGAIQPPAAGAPHSLADLLAQSSGGILVGSTVYATIADAVAAALAAAAQAELIAGAVLDDSLLPLEHASRAALVSAVGSGLAIVNGFTYRAGGVSYIGSTGATAIADLPGLEYLGLTTAPAKQGFFADESNAVINRIRDRVFVGGAAAHTGNRLGANGYGGDVISENIATWVIKNSGAVFAADETNGRIGITGAAYCAPGVAGAVVAGVVGIARHDGTTGSSRGGYFEAIHNATGATTVSTGAEIQTGNMTATAPVVSAYDMSGSVVNGLQIAPESQHGYTTGDSDTAYPTPTQPAGAAIDVSGGSLGAAYQKYTGGMVFRNGALVRDGNNFARALMMAQKHKLQWEVSAGVEGAAIWSEVTDGAQDMSLAFQNRNLTVLGSNGNAVAKFRHDGAGAGAVNNSVFRAARTGVNPAILSEGSDAIIGIDMISKSTGVIRFQSHDGSGENFRVVPSASAATDCATVTGSAGGGNVTFGAAGASTNIDILLTPKGSGVVRFGAYTTLGAEALAGYITIKDAGGTLRKVAVVA